LCGITATNGTVGTTNCNWTGPNGFTSTSCTGIMNLEPGVYILTVVDENNCEFTETYTVEGQADPCFGVMIEITFSIDNESIAGANDGSLEAIVVGNNSAVVDYTWTDELLNTYSGNPITDLAPGLYTVVVTTELGCQAALSVDVGAGADPCLNFEIVDFSTTGNSCVGGVDGMATVLVEGGLAPYTYEWSDMTSDTQTASNLPAGAVSVIVTDANDCTVVGEVLITEPETELIIASITGINESIPGANNGSASVILSGGDSPYTYVWTGPNGFTATTMNIEDLEPGEYCVIGTDENGCSVEGCATVSAANDPCLNLTGEVFINGGEILDCVNTETELSYEANFGESPYTVEWSGDNQLTQTTETIIVDEPGLVTITVTDVNGCMVEASVVVDQDVNQPQSTLMISNSSSETAADGSAFLTNVTPGSSTVAWFDDAGMLIGEELTIDGLAPGTYTVVLTNADNGCFTTDEFIIVAEMVDCAAFSISVDIENITCVDAANGVAQIDVSNGTSPVAYNWDPALPDSPIQSNLPPGTYAVTVTDANGCMDDLSFEITDPDPFTVSIAEVGSSLTATVEGGVPDYTYAWSTGNLGETIDIDGDGEYCVTVTDGNSCIAEECFTVGGSNDCDDFEAELVFTNQISCFEANDGALQVNVITAVEPITYEWSDGLPSTQTQTDLGPGVYSVLVTDANNCTYEAELELTEPESELMIVLSSTVVTSIGGSDGTATVVATGGNEGLDYVYIWDDSNQQSTATATDLSPGVYCVTVASGGCFAEECIEVFDADNPCIEFEASIFTTDVSCFDVCDGTGIITIEGGLEPYQFTWSDGVDGMQERDDLCGSGSVTVSDANDCSTVIEFLINVPSELEVVVSSTNATEVTSSDGSTNAAAFGGTAPYTYNWDNSTIGTTINNLLPGIYTVTVTDDNGCTVEASVEVGVGEDQCDNFTGTVEITDISCFEANDGSATVTTQGGYRYSEEQVI